jgi:DNA gyrase subunit A
MSEEENLSPNPTDNQVRHTLDDEMRTSYINYAMSVIVGRALPDVRDGLKPVHRRVLFGMHEAGHTADRSYSKSARSVGEVMGKYHPHGDQSIYDTMVRMAQEFSLRYPLIDGQGNFGSIDGDPPAAMRYTESRLDRLAGHMLEDIKKGTVDFQPNFDDSEQEPEVLPARLPNLLLNGSDGIAVGMATKIPPHNLPEVAAAVHLHIDRILEEGEENGDPETPPTIDVSEYMVHLKGPDFPTGAMIYGIDGIRDMYETGHGKFHIRADCDVLDDDDGKRIIVHEIPYQVKKAGMLEGIADMVSKETIKGIRDIRDESSKEGIRVVIEVKQNADPHAVLNQLFKSSRLQESYSANMMGILNREPVLLTLPVILHTYVRHREQVIRRRTLFELAKAEARAHVLEGLVLAQARIDEIVTAGKGAESRENFEQILRGDIQFGKIPKFAFTEPQAKAIAERRLYQLSKMDTKKVEDEFNDLQASINEYNSILGSRRRQLEILLAELDEIVHKHGDDRRTSIDPMPLSMDREDLIEERALVISLSEDDYIRHLPAEVFRVQNRGGRGVKGVTTKTEDAAKLIVSCFSKDRILIFTNKPFAEGHKQEGRMDGRVYGIKAWETPQSSRQAKGSHIRNVLTRIQDDEVIVSILPITNEMEANAAEHYIYFATRNGRVKKTPLSQFVGDKSINKTGKRALILPEGDRLVGVRHGSEDAHVVLISNLGRACRFQPSMLKERDGKLSPILRAMGRNTQPKIGIKLHRKSPESGETESLGHLVGMIVSDEEDTAVLTISKFGMAKRTRLGTGHMIPKLDAEGQPITEDGKVTTVRDGFAESLNRGTQGVNSMGLRGEGFPTGHDPKRWTAMTNKAKVEWHNAKFPENELKNITALEKLWPGDEIVRIHQIPDVDDQIFLLAGSGMLIRFAAHQTAESGRVAKGTWVMEVRDKVNGGFADEIISSARLPAELIGEDDGPTDAIGDEEE